ncbi:MAG: hypothetical protein L0220_31365 [Acidobacteria bacterium]|nr:hypothetical protein [Acidobacteriota bacterium]
MKRICLSAVSAVILMLPVISIVFGQKSTEQYIPMGKSPGVTRKYSIMGEIEQYDASSKSLTVISSSGKTTIKLTDQSRIYLDRSKLRQRNTRGNFSDLKKGRYVEVKYKDPQNKTGCDWIKIEISGGG